jgi:hypothetical protein
MSPAAATVARPWEIVEPDGGASNVVVDLSWLSPELVLVSPDLRDAALALLPDRELDGWIPPPYRPPPAAREPAPDGRQSPPSAVAVASPAVAPIPVAPRASASDAPLLSRRALALAAAAYAGQSLVGALATGAALLAATAALAVLADVLHP